MNRLAPLPLALFALFAAWTAQAAEPAVELTVPAGTYKLDPNHASLVGKVQHLNLAPYSVRFVKFEVTLNLDPGKLAASSVEVKVDPNSVRTDYTGDYKGTHKDSPFNSFEEALSTGPMFLNSKQFPAITFKSTKVVPKGKGRLQITGDFTLLGKTQPITLDATVTGAIAQHPRSKAAAVGFSATGTFKRSDFGMNIGIGKFLGDEVTVHFDGELQQQVAPPPA